jgi:hypothetical protein
MHIKKSVEIQKHNPTAPSLHATMKQHKPNKPLDL